MKRIHGTDNRKRDILWAVPNYIAFVVFYLTALGLCGFLLYDVSLGNKDPFGHLFEVGCILMFDLGILDASWRNAKYEIREDGIFVKSLARKKCISWNSIVSCGVFTVFLIPGEMPRDYIVVFLSETRPAFPVDLTYCSIHKRKMLVIRATPYRIEEIRTALTNHGISWLNS